MKLADLYERDETAWLEKHARLLAEQRYQGLDYANLLDFLESMARRDKRELHSRLRQLLIHLLKWQFQPRKRTRSWENTIAQQRASLRKLLESKALRNTADQQLAEYFEESAERCARETQLERSAFPKRCPYRLDFLLSEDLPQSSADADDKE